MAARKKFSDHIREIVDEFLQTVVIVDDRALQGPRPPENDEGDDEGSPSSSTGGLAITDVEAPPGDASVADELPAREVIDAFASKGLVCAILHPDDAVDVKLVKAAARADLMVGDWVIHESRGTPAIEL